MAQAYNALSSIYAALLLHKISPVKAVGFSSFVNIAFIKMVQTMCPNRPAWTYLIGFPMFFAVAIGTLSE
jgi:hypothetical protein